jgi:hypothetical protein
VTDIDHSPQFSDDVTNEWSYTSTPLYTFMAWTGTDLSSIPLCTYICRGVHKSWATKFCTVAPNISSIIIAVFFLPYEDVCQFTCTEQNAPDN